MLLRSVSYHEILPHLVMSVFLHRAVNVGGKLARECAIETDQRICSLRYGEMTLVAIEPKVWQPK